MKRAAKSGKSTATKADENKNGNPLFVGIGASAGGIKALKEFFANVSKDSGNVYVVILHLSPEHDSKLAEILQLTSEIPVRQVQDERVKVKPDCVYVIPPNRTLEMNDGHLSTSAFTSDEVRRAPIDIFFRTLAESHESHAVSIVLSGTGADGSMGMKRVKERGGILIVQDPKEAEYDDMPRNSIATGLVDYVLPVAEIPSQINVYKNNLQIVKIEPELERQPEADERALREIFAQLRIRTGHDFSNYKRQTLLRRITRRINVHGLPNLIAYSQFILENVEESQALLKDLLISVTNFFRDPESFDVLEHEVIPKILEARSAEDTVRIWVAGCATGEEAYSLAMLFAEQARDLENAPAVQIFATDIDERAIAQARAGLYTPPEVADVSPARLNHFFVKEAKGFRIRREIREMVLFAVHNVTKDPPFSYLDLITCRNLLIYLNRMAQSRVIEIFHFGLKPGGFLFLGSSEAADGASNLFSPFSRESRIYQSRRSTERPLYISGKAPTALIGSTFRERVEQLDTDELRVLDNISYTSLHQQLLEEYAPPSVVVNRDYDIVHISENAGRYFQIRGGEPSKNILRIIRPELRLELRAALIHAVQNQVNVSVEGLSLQIDERTERLNIIVRPVFHETDAKRGFILVIFEPASDSDRTQTESLRASEPVALRLEEELDLTKNQLRTAVEQYEMQTEELRASNEELQAVNEEMRSAVEEIETSKEELQSVNEELITVNDELSIKVQLLAESTNDLQSLMNSTDIGTIFLDRELHVKLFTDSVTAMVNLLPADLGRPITDITNRFKYGGLLDDIKKVLNTLQTIEREIVTEENRWFLMRVFPYRTSKEQINGVVITFLEITNRINAERSIRFQASLLDAAEQSVIATDLQGKVVFWNRFAERLYGWTAKEAVGQNILDLTTPELMSEQAAAIMEQLRQGKSWTGEFEVKRRDGATFPAQVINSPIIDDEGNLIGVVGVSVDVTERRRAERQIQLNEERLRLLIESASDYAIFTVTRENKIDSWNPGAERIFGFTEKEIIGKDGAILFTPEDRERGVHLLEIKCALETGKAEDERWHVRKDGSRFYASGVMQPLGEGGEEGFVKICRDQTAKLVTETAVRDKEMLQHLVTAQEDERRRIARDIHDHLGQQLTVLRLKLEAVKEICEDETVCDGIDEAQTVAEQIDRDADFLAWELRPASLDDLGLRVTLENFVNQWASYTKTKTEFHGTGLNKSRLVYEIETNLYRIAQEALNNIHKHAKADNVSVLLEKRGKIVSLIIEDDGIGFNVGKVMNRAKGIGLISMRERAAMCGGTLEIESAKGKGTTVFVRVPAKM